jgi:hypothetical protein
LSSVKCWNKTMGFICTNLVFCIKTKNPLHWPGKSWVSFPASGITLLDGPIVVIQAPHASKNYVTCMCELFHCDRMVSLNTPLRTTLSLVLEVYITCTIVMLFCIYNNINNTLPQIRRQIEQSVLQVSRKKRQSRAQRSRVRLRSTNK